MTKPTIGFIGLGLMGRAMVECLQKAGYSVMVLGHRDRTGIDEALSRGGSEAASARELAQASDIVMFCMGTSDHVESRVYGEEGVLAGAKDGQILIDFGTSLPSSTERIGKDLAAKGAAYLDAPLGRTPAHAVDGLLNIMCAGDKDAYARAKPTLDCLGENVFHLGALGNGHKIKLMNNFFAMTTAMAMAEVFAVSDTVGVPRQMVYDVMAAGPNHSGMMDFIKNYATDGQIDLAFSVENAAKDVGYYKEMTRNFGVTSRMADCADATLRAARDSGSGDLNVPEMVDWMTRNLGDA
ncbi:NAD(P)-dependent oxidoreductase [Maribius pontilimi]|uniref:NAD(P)-dependent oxidoreductase n=1 Tax=Palleronia pontilimi TaxID=1964209 RepID=A0A934IBI9_9RHOB|nr:NAD(P)-dependent oxidoreductase [Palleronia pontilimi]MBJ3764064.1 NAD(P)-dependent oxidoreductase [Palleronia pontilimi]